jgi:predicted nucleic acid-binding protein
MIFIDTNIWCYYFDKRLPESQQVKEFMRKALLSEEIACNTLIILEVAHYLVRHLKPFDAQRKIDVFTSLSNLTIQDFDRKNMTLALDKLIEHGYSDGLGGRDATVITSMQQGNIQTVVSHDEVFKRLSTKLNIQVIDPIKSFP